MFLFFRGLPGDKWLNNVTHILKMIFIFQCLHKFAVSDETMHILSHYVRADAAKLCAKFREWIWSHHDWVEAITDPVLSKKGSNVDDYIYFIAKPGTPVYEIGLLIFERMYHLHMCIIMEDRYWTMQHENNLDRCTVFIAYRGVLLFNDTRPKCKEYSLHPRNPMPIPSPDINVTKSGHQKPAGACTTWTSYKAGVISDKEINELWRKYNKPKPVAKLGIPVVKLKHLEEKLNKTPKVKKPKTKDIKTPTGSVNIHQHGIPVRTKHKVTLKCPADGCTKTFNLQKDLTTYVLAGHPTFGYSCEHCTKTFQSFSVVYKHAKKHGSSLHMCKYCQKGFYFRKHLIIHKHLHTGKNLIPCTNCNKQFTSKRLLQQHAITHHRQVHQCQQCNTKASTAQNLKIHIRGEHGDG